MSWRVSMRNGKIFSIRKMSKNIDSSGKRRKFAKKSNKRLNQYLRVIIYNYRHDNELSQELMAEVLDETPRCYIEQEMGRSGYSLQTFCRFLLTLSDKEVLELVHGMKKENVWEE